ncbi:MAG: histidine--tRNA ligase [Puniceicoccales bacterium]|jgi:histidyl-tRNA synthetase|nr:histidine--tRNA ligase [Puniceicoccales bacterium]
MSTFQALAGFRDFYPDDCAFKNFVFERFRQSATTFGFEEYDAPILEPMELFTAKSGEEIVSQLFNFEDKGGRSVAMRPEMTPSLARMVGARASALRRPIKWFSISEMFRYERPQKGRLRSFYQFNADIFGNELSYADAEIILLGIHMLKSFGLTAEDFHVRLSDRQLWTLFIRYHNIGEDDVPEVLGIIDKIEREEPSKTIENLDKICRGDGRKIFDDILEIRTIHSVDGIRKFFKKFENDACAKRIDELAQLLARMKMFGVSDFVTIDFNIVRGLAYYTGFVFEIFERSGQSRALAGGGRYDNLIKRLGYADLPAVGFAIGDVTLRNLLKEKNIVPKLSKNTHCFVVYSTQTEMLALQQATMLREQRINTDYCLDPATFSKQLKMAAQADAKYAIIFGEEEAKTGHAKIKDMSSANEIVVEIDRLVEVISR